MNVIKIQVSLKGTRYPASKSSLVQQAKNNGADGDVMLLLDRIPAIQYGNPAAVMHELGKVA